MEITHKVPRFISSINILEQLLEFMAFQFFNSLEGSHNLLFQSFFSGVVFFLRPPPPGLHKESESDDGVVDPFQVLDFLTRTVGKGIIGGGVMPNAKNVSRNERKPIPNEVTDKSSPPPIHLSHSRHIDVWPLTLR
jgi:hypothetical protein